VEEAAASGAGRLVLAGGDGSVAPAAAAAGRAGIPLALIPVGTANDFARAMDLPEEHHEACRLAVEGDRLAILELGLMDERPFVNAANAGLAVPAARRAAAWKRVLGPLSYTVGAVAAGLTERPLRARVIADGRELFDGDAWQVSLACTGAFGGGSELGSTDPGDGLLDVAVKEARSRLGLVPYAWSLRRGGVTDRSGVRSARAQLIELELPSASAYNVDGEVVEAGSARFTSRANAFQLVAG